MAFRVIISDFQQQYEALRAVRNSVFIVEQQIPAALEYDDADLRCLHAVAWDGQKPVGTARLDVLEDGRIGRVAVLKDYRRRGVGSLLMQELEQIARSRGLVRLWFHSQISAVPFYESLGYSTYGEEYLEAGIPHLSMEKRI
jgi:predicted GNAT family N-acyltransferase